MEETREREREREREKERERKREREREDVHKPPAPHARGDLRGVNASDRATDTGQCGKAGRDSTERGHNGRG